MERHVHSSSKLQAEFKIRSMSFLDLFNLFVLKRCILKAFRRLTLVGEGTE